jgi:capsular exopolysaccharide synthesis family protein
VALLRQRYKADYPELRDAAETEEQLRAQFEEACDTAVFALKTRYEMLTSREEGLLAALKEQERQAFSLARQLIQYDDLKRNVEADREIHQAVIARMKETSVSETLPTQLIRIAEDARPAARPFRPQPGLVLLRGAMLGLALGLGAIFLSYIGDHRFRRTEEVERALGVPVLACFPVVPGQTVHERGLICHLNRKGETAEAFRSLRAVLQVTPSLKTAKVLMVSSSQPGDGKSLIAANLAICLAQDGRRTLLVGCDLRRPAYEQIFKTQNMPSGLAEVLRGEAAWKAVLQSGLVPGLDVLPAGKCPTNPSELLGSARLGELMAEFRTAYEYVVMDASPIVGVSDSLLLMGHADGVLFTVRRGVTRSQGAVYAIRRIVESGTPCLGTLMNGVSPRTLGSYYGYGCYGADAYQARKGHHETEESI